MGGAPHDGRDMEGRMGRRTGNGGGGFRVLEANNRVIGSDSEDGGPEALQALRSIREEERRCGDFSTTGPYLSDGVVLPAGSVPQPICSRRRRRPSGALQSSVEPVCWVQVCDLHPNPEQEYVQKSPSKSSTSSTL
jgi:hypothetical protein